MSTCGKGRAAEDRAAEYLSRMGCTLLSRNFRCKAGEIDIVAARTGILHFVEVKLIEGAGRESLAVSVNSQKQKRIAESAQFFLQLHREYSNCSAQFDVIAVSDTVDWIEHAFLESR